MSSHAGHRRCTPVRRRPGAGGPLLLHAALLTGLPCAGAQAESVGLAFSLSSATVLRGAALSEDGVDAHAAASYADPSGWRAALGAAALHVKASPRRWDTQLFWRLGYAQPLAEDWSAQLAHTRYTYPGSALLRPYARDELVATLAYRDLLYLSMAGLRNSRAAHGASRDSVAYDIVARHPVGPALIASAGLGYLQTRRSSFAYAYGHAGLAARWGATQAQLVYIATDSAAKERFGPVAANRWTASLGWDF